MTRQTFAVAINGNVKLNKFAFNSARREIVNLVREHGQIGETWVMISEQQTKEGPNRVATVMVWKCEQTGEEITCSVQKV